MLEGCLTSLKISSLKKKGFQFLHGLAQRHHHSNIYWCVYLFVIYLLL